jgi:hypothetical protein
MTGPKRSPIYNYQLAFGFSDSFIQQWNIGKREAGAGEV